MTRSIVGLLLALCPLLSGCADKARENREFLLAHGFKQSATDRDIYELKNVRLTDVSRDLGFPLAALRPTDNQPFHSDVRIVQVHALHFVVRSEVRDAEGRIVDWSLNDPNAICTVSVSVNPVLPGDYLKTDSSPRIRIQSVTLPQDRSKPLQVTFELAADGKTPLAVSQRQFGIKFTTQGNPPQKVPGLGVSFPKGTPQRITVSPGKPIILTASTSGTSWNPVTRGPWSDLPSAVYVLCVALGSMKSQGPSFDYQWVGDKFSDEYKLVIK